MKTFDKMIMVISSVLIVLFVALFLFGIGWLMSNSIDGARGRHEERESERQELIEQTYGTAEEAFRIIQSFEASQSNHFGRINWVDYKGDTLALTYRLEEDDNVSFSTELSEFPYDTEQFEKELLEIIIGQ